MTELELELEEVAGLSTEKAHALIDRMDRRLSIQSAVRNPLTRCPACRPTNDPLANRATATALRTTHPPIHSCMHTVTTALSQTNSLTHARPLRFCGLRARCRQIENLHHVPVFIRTPVRLRSLREMRKGPL